MPSGPLQQSEEIRERLVRLESKGEHRSESLERIQDVLEDLVKYTARNEDNRRHIEKLDGRLDKIEQRVEQQRSWLQSRVWFITTAVALVATLVTLFIKFL